MKYTFKTFQLKFIKIFEFPITRKFMLTLKTFMLEVW